MPLEFLEQYFLDTLTNGSRVFFARYVDDAGKKTPECISPQEELHTASILQIQDAGGRSQQVLDGALKQFIARKRVENMQKRLATVTRRIDRGRLEHALHLQAQQWNVSRTLAVRDRRKKTDKALFSAALPLRSKVLTPT